jgi:hypothetical protein
MELKLLSYRAVVQMSEKVFLSRLISFARNFDFIPAVAMYCDIAQGIVDGINDTFGTNLKISDPTLTSSEVTILDNWDLNQFMPFVKTIFEGLQNLNKTSLSNNQRIQFANDILLKIKACSEFYKTNNTNGLSNNVISFRNTYIKNAFEEFYKYFNSETETLFQNYEWITIQEQINVNTLPFLNVQGIINYSCDLFKIPNVSVLELTPSQSTIQNNPVPVVNATIEGASSSTNIAINQKPKSETYNPVYIVGFSILTYFGLRYAFNKSDEKK